MIEARAMRRLLVLAVLAALLAPAPAGAQLFVASRPQPPFAIGPLMVRATVSEGTGPVPVVVSFSLQLPPNRTAADVAQDLYLLWPTPARSRRWPEGRPSSRSSRPARSA